MQGFPLPFSLSTSFFSFLAHFFFFHFHSLSLFSCFQILRPLPAFKSCFHFRLPLLASNTCFHFLSTLLMSISHFRSLPPTPTFYLPLPLDFPTSTPNSTSRFYNPRRQPTLTHFDFPPIIPLTLLSINPTYPTHFLSHFHFNSTTLGPIKGNISGYQKLQRKYQRKCQQKLGKRQKKLVDIGGGYPGSVSGLAKFLAVKGICMQRALKIS